MKQTWQVILMIGDSEPWWFFPDWEKDITAIYGFDHKTAALEKYTSLFNQMRNQYEFHKVKKTYTAAFWNDDDLFFCENCDDDLQQYNGLLILHNQKPYVIEDE